MPCSPRSPAFALALSATLGGLWGCPEEGTIARPHAPPFVPASTTLRDSSSDAAIVALSLAVVADNGHSLPIDPALHAPLDQQLVVCGSGQEAADARELAKFVNSTEGREIMTRYGFQLADGQKP